MSDNTNPIDDTDNLDDFEKEFFETKDEVKEEDQDIDADDSTEEDSLATEDDAEEVEENSEEDDDPEEDEAPKPKKKQTFQERINELTAQFREEQRARQELERKLAEKEKAKDPEPVKTPQVAASDDGRPNSDAKNEDGTPKYPLGEFDPQYVVDLADWRFDQKTKAFEEAQLKKQEEAAKEAAQKELHNQWQEKLAKAKEVHEDFDEQGAKLEPIFASLDPTFGEYIAATIMSMNTGPEIVYYLSQNLEEAKEIMSSGPTQATIALGRLEGIFSAQEKATKKKVSEAPEPPAVINKGRAPTREIPDDTDDLEAFEKKFFRKR